MAVKTKKKPAALSRALLLALLAGGISTLFWPMMRLETSVGRKVWSAYDIARSLPQSRPGRPQPAVRIPKDFTDVLTKLAHEKTRGKSAPPAFYLGLLVPVALVLTYVCFGFGLCFWALRWTPPVRPAGLVSLWASLYVLAGMLALSREVERRFGAASRDSGWLAFLAKNLSLRLEPDKALFALPVFALALFLTARSRR